MTELGFWRLAQADPDRVALVAPDGTEHTAGELLAAANQVATGCGRSGCETGDTVACVVPNGLEMLELYLGATQIGLYITPINHHLVGPEIAYIVNDSDAKVLVGHERFAGRARRRRRPRSTSAADHRFADRRRRRLPPVRRAHRRPARHGAREPHRRRADALHVGHHRPAQGREAGAGRHRPRRAGRAATAASRGCSACSRSTATCTSRGSPLYHTAVLMWTANALHLGHKVVLMDKWAPEGMLELIDAAPGHDQPHGADPVPPPAGPARGRARLTTTCRRCAAWCTPPRRARPRSSAG